MLTEPAHLPAGVPGPERHSLDGFAAATFHALSPDWILVSGLSVAPGEASGVLFSSDQGPVIQHWARARFISGNHAHIDSGRILVFCIPSQKEL